MKKRKFQIGDKVVFKQTQNWRVYKIHSFTKYADGTYCYWMYSDDDMITVYPYQIKKVKVSNIWFTTQ